MVDVRLDCGNRHVEFPGDFSLGEVGRQVAQHANLCFAQRLQQRLRVGEVRRRPLASEQVQDLREQRGVRRAT
jgi:hypothetical protein